MAESAPIYDRDKKEPVTRPDLQVLKGGGETTPPTGSLSAAPEPADLAKKEEATTDPHQLGRGYKPDNPEELSKLKPSVAGVFGFAKNNRGKLILGGAAAGFLSLLIVGFLVLIPFKILHIVNNLQNRFFATSENAVQKETDVLFSDYLRKYVMPGLTTCRGSTIDRNCTPKDITGNSIVARLYGGWKTARLENTIAEKYGLEFKKVGAHFYMKTPGMTGDGANIDSFVHPDQQQLFSLDDYIDKSRNPQFQKVGRSELRQAYRDALQNETMWKRVMYRYKVGGYLSKKFGLKRCIIACNTRDDFNDWKDNKTRAAKMILAEKVLAPRGETLALVIQCVLDGGCDPSNRSQTDTDVRKISDIQAKLQDKLATLAAQDTGKYADVLAHSNDILKDGYKTYIVKRIARAIIGDATSTIDQQAAEKIAGNLVPVIGWVNTASSTIGTLERAPAKIKALSYMTNAAAMVSLYTTYRVYADETKTGNIDPAILGSFTDSLGPSDKTSLGGVTGAEAAPLYTNLIGGKSAQDSQSSTYKCKDGNSVPAGHLVCPEEILGSSNSSVSKAIDGVLGNLGPLKNLADFWNSTIGAPFRAAAHLTTYIADSILKVIPGYSQLLDYVTNAAKPIISYLTDWLIPSPFSDNMSGGRTFNLMAGGADVSGNDYAQNGLGSRALSPQQAAAILNEQTQQNIQKYKSQSLFARIFNTNSEYSLVSRMAVAMPSSWNSAGQTVASIFSNPLGKFGHSFASLFSLNHAFAAATGQADPFGVTQYGYPSDDPRLAAANADPEKYWDENCSTDGTNLDWSDSTVNGKWQNSTTTNQDTGMPENNSTNPCLLIQASVGSAGAMYDSSLLTPDDQAGSGSNGQDTSPVANPAATAGVYNNPLRDIANLSPLRIDEGVDYGGHGNVYALGNGVVVSTSCSWFCSYGESVVYKLTDGPAAGKSVFFSESCTPSVRVGQKVDSNTVICHMHGDNSPWIETGWALGNGTDEPAAGPVYHNYADGTAMAYGVNFSQLLKSLGAPPGDTSRSTNWPTVGGSLPAGWPTW